MLLNKECTQPYNARATSTSACLSKKMRRRHALVLPYPSSWSMDMSFASLEDLCPRSNEECSTEAGGFPLTYEVLP